MCLPAGWYAGSFRRKRPISTIRSLTGARASAQSGAMSPLASSPAIPSATQEWSPGQERLATPLADLDGEDRLVARVALDRGLVGDQDPGAEERRAARGVERDGRPVVPGHR